jgi:hypothetical protein
MGGGVRSIKVLSFILGGGLESIRVLRFYKSILALGFL